MIVLRDSNMCNACPSKQWEAILQYLIFHIYHSLNRSWLTSIDQIRRIKSLNGIEEVLIDAYDYRQYNREREAICSVYSVTGCAPIKFHITQTDSWMHSYRFRSSHSLS